MPRGGRPVACFLKLPRENRRVESALSLQCRGEGEVPCSACLGGHRGKQRLANAIVVQLDFPWPARLPQTREAVDHEIGQCGVLLDLDTCRATHDRQRNGLARYGDDLEQPQHRRWQTGEPAGVGNDGSQIEVHLGATLRD